jgi:YaiO family outer membrane protein
MRKEIRTFILLVLLGAGTPGLLRADEKPAQRHEVVLMVLYGNFGAYPRSDDRIASAQYYHTAGSTLKLFGEAGSSTRFGRTDFPFGAGAYWKAGQKDYLYAYLLFAVNPAVVANADLTAEYTRVLVKALTGSLGYRLMIFPRETVHIVIPALDLYAIPRWTITGRAYLSTLASASSVQTAFLARAAYDWSDRFTTIVTASAGSEAYRAGSLQDFGTSHSWSAGIGLKIQLSGPFRLRVGYDYIRRSGVFKEDQLTLSTSYMW